MVIEHKPLMMFLRVVIGVDGASDYKKVYWLRICKMGSR
jgi:hypothetical protein